MKKFATVSLALSLMAAMLVSCGECYEKMQKKQDQIQVTCNPEVMEYKNSAIVTDITVSFPENYFNAETILKITPVLVYEGGELVGPAKYVQGEDVVGNYTAISRFEGGSYTQHLEFPFVADNNVAKGTLELRIEGKCYDDCKETPDFVALATIAATKGVKNYPFIKSPVKPTDIKKVENLALLDANYEKSITSNQNAEIHYLINSSTVRKSQLTQEQIKLFTEFIANNSNAENTELSAIQASGYASPDGPEKFNNKLSEKRSQTGAKAIKKELKGVEGLNYEIASYGEDWDGFKTLVENSDIEDKELILNVLQMYSSPVERDKEIQNMRQVFKVLAEEILPQLRRTRFNVDATYTKQDAQIFAAAKAGDTSLTASDMLYAATLTNDNAEKVAIYELAINTHNDARAYNNLAVVKGAEGKLDEAKAALNSSIAIEPNDVVSTNMAVLLYELGDIDGASAFAQGINTKAASDIRAKVAIYKGQYGEAKNAATNGLTLALAEFCADNLEGAKAALNGVNGADADLLRAKIANREGETTKAVAFLKSAIAADPSLKEEVMYNYEFEELLAEYEI